MRLQIGLKYCGGCNPDYDRVVALERIMWCLGVPIDFVSYEEKDVCCTLIIKGCATECIDLSPFKGKPILVLMRWEDVERVSDELKKLIARHDKRTRNIKK